MFLLFLSILISFFLMFLFFMASKKFNNDFLMMSMFECGFTPYFFSRFSFSMHYYIIGLIFLFLDLELCYLLPFFNQNFSSINIMVYSWIFVLILILGLLEEWKSKVLDWKF